MWRAETRDDQLLHDWELVARVAKSHPRLLSWLAEGQVTWYWNLFGTMIALLRVIPGLRWLVWHFLFEPVASNAPWRPELREAVLQERRYQQNREPDSTEPDATLAIAGTTGLSAVTDVTKPTHTEARDEVRGKLQVMSSGCIGVSGPRGSGKSTVIRDLCEERYGTPVWSDPPAVTLPGLRLMVQAPVPYDARDFLVHLYTCLCKVVLADVRFNLTSFGRHLFFAVLVPRSIRPAALLRALASIGLLIVAASLAYRAVSGHWPLSSWPLRNWEVAGSAVAALIALSIIGWRTRRALLEARQIVTLATDAQDRLDRLHFQRTETRSSSGTLGGPAGTSLNFTSTSALTEQMMTLPELVDDYRDFAERVGAALQAGPAMGTVVIGIDQLDQIEDTQASGRFLDELSSVFGTPHCVYLLAVSPSTLAAVGQQLVPLKTASSGIFDEVVWIEPLDLEQACDLLDHRVTGRPAAFAELCYVLSGGLPRDLLRVARSIFPTHPGAARTPGDLTAVTRDVIADEIHALKHRALAHAASLDIPASTDLLERLTDHDWPLYRQPPSLSVIKNVLDDVSTMAAATARERAARLGTPEDPRTAEICDSFLAGLYFLLTVYWLFTTPADRPDPGRLAHARNALSQDPYLATAIFHDTLKAAAKRAGRPYPVAEIEPQFLRYAATHRQLSIAPSQDDVNRPLGSLVESHDG